MSLSKCHMFIPESPESPRAAEQAKTCRNCTHGDVCLYIWEFTFEGTDSRKNLRKGADLDLPRWPCGNWRSPGLSKSKVEELAEKISAEIFTDGTGRTINRLVAEYGESQGGCGWAKFALKDLIKTILSGGKRGF